MNVERLKLVEDLQRLVVRAIARHPAGHRLCMIGGFRYRLMNQSCRMSDDIDYHWDGDLAGKQAEIVDLLRAAVLPEAQRQFRCEGDARPATGPDADSPVVKTVDLAFYRRGEPGSRIEIPVEITSIPCADVPIVRTVDGTVYLTASDADMIESKAIALLNRTYVQARDILDLFLFQDRLVADSATRVREKLDRLGVSAQAVIERCHALEVNRERHIKAVEAVMNEQVEASVAANLRAAGGARMIFDAAMAILDGRLGVTGRPSA